MHRRQTSDILKLIPAFKVLQKQTLSTKPQKLPLNLRRHQTPEPSGLTVIKRVSRDLDSVTAAVNRIQARLHALPGHKLDFERGVECGEALTERHVERQKGEKRDFRVKKRFPLLRYR